MKKWLPVVVLVLLAVEFGASAFAPNKPPKLTDSIGIISDVDDTVRPTGTLHPARALEVATGAKKVKAFSGMSELYRQLLLSRGGTTEPDEYFVSGAPITLSEDLRPFLKENSFSIDHVTVRVGGPIQDIGSYKQGQFKKLLKNNPKTSFYFFGDDTQKDPESVAYAQKNFPTQMAGLYIHRIEDKMPAKPEAGEIPYFTAVDIALHELYAGHLTTDQVGLVAQAMLDDTEFNDDVIPSYAKLCPPSGWLTALVSDLKIPDPLPSTLTDQLSAIESGVAKVCTPDRKPHD